MIKAVLDSNVFVSGTVVSLGYSYQILEAWRWRKFTLLVSKEIISEISRVLNYSRIKRKYNLTPKRIKRLVYSLKQNAKVTPGDLQLKVIKEDPSDDKFLACAVEGSADYIVSGNAHLLKLKNYKGVKILTPKEFVKILAEKEKTAV